MSGVKLTDIVEKMNLKNLTPEVDITEREVLVPDVNRPALQLAGFFDHFDLNRVQIIGNVECAYLETLTEERRLEIYQKLLEHKVPCIIFSNELQPDEVFWNLRRRMIFRYSVHVRRHHPLWETDPLAECKTCSVHFYSWSAC